MSAWNEILSMEEEPRLTGLGREYSLVARDVKRQNVYEDIYQVHLETFAVANQRFSASSPRNDFVTRFYWAKSIAVILQAVYGSNNGARLDYGRPPEELRVGSGHCTYGAILDHAAKHGLHYSKRLVPSQNLSSQPYVGICISVARADYYFVCNPEESADLKDWSHEQVLVIGLRTFRSRPLESIRSKVAGHGDTGKAL